MSWVVFSLYFVIGELTVLLALSDEEGAAQAQWLAQKGEWIPYIGAVVAVTAWPAAAPLLLMLAKKK
jgi:hypothetical protein